MLDGVSTHEGGPVPPRYDASDATNIYGDKIYIIRAQTNTNAI